MILRRSEIHHRLKPELFSSGDLQRISCRRAPPRSLQCWLGQHRCGWSAPLRPSPRLASATPPVWRSLPRRPGRPCRRWQRKPGGREQSDARAGCPPDRWPDRDPWAVVAPALNIQPWTSNPKDAALNGQPRPWVSCNRTVTSAARQHPGAPPTGSSRAEDACWRQESPQPEDASRFFILIAILGETTRLNDHHLAA